MRSLRLRRFSLVAAVLTLPFVASSCATDGVAGPGEEAALATLPVSANVIGTPVATIVIDVSAPNIPTPLTFNLTVVGGVANGTLRLPPGNSRLITGRAFDSRGDITHEGSTTIDVRPGNNPSVSINLVPRAGQVPITIHVGVPIITINPGSATATVGNSILYTATITGQNGQPIDGTVEWASTNPTVALVNAAGSVTGVWEGSALIVATFAGSAATAQITVPTCVQPYTFGTTTTSASLVVGDCRRQSGGFFPGAFSFGQLMDIYGATANSQRSLQFDMNGAGGFDTFIIQDNVARSVAASDDDSGVGLSSSYHIILASGDYLIAASTYNPGTVGAYTFTTADVAEAVTGCPSPVNQWVTPGITTNQSLQSTDCGGAGTGPVSDQVNLALVQNQVVTVTQSSTSFAVQLGVSGPGLSSTTNGSSVGGASVATTTFVAAGTGTFLLTLSHQGVGHALGSYSLSVR
jgi:hypothetical protein